MLKTIKKVLITLSLTSIAIKLTLVIVIFLYPNIISANNIEANAKEIVDLTNKYRVEQGLEELKPNARLTQAAVNKAHDLLINQYFSHTSPDGRKFSQWIRDVEYKYFYVGENLAIDFDDNEKIFDAWLDSPSHKENIIKPQYQEIGIAVVEGKYKNRQTVVVVQLFGSRVLGSNETTTDTYNPISGFTNNYFPDESLWKKITSLRNLEKLNEWNNYFLIIIVGLYLASYTPVKRKNQINIKQPIINRYHAKIFKE
jgi:hypothetical protein